MRRHFTLITLFSCQALVAALALFLYYVARPDFAEAYRDFPGPIPRQQQETPENARHANHHHPHGG